MDDTRKLPFTRFSAKSVGDFRRNAIELFVGGADGKYFPMSMSNVAATPVMVALRATPGIGLGVAAPSYPPLSSVGPLDTGEGNYMASSE